MQAGEVVNMDMSAFYGGYSADITRTVPVSGKFSAEQRTIYEIVLAAQKAAERQIKIDYLGFTIPNKFVVGYGLDIAQQFRNLPFIGYQGA